MRAFRFNLTIAALLAASVCAYADLTPGIDQVAPAQSFVSVSGDDAIGRDWIDDGLTVLAEVSVPSHFESERPTNVIELPPSPGSMGLFLSGALSIGAWHLVRSARNLHFTNLPDWYHSGGPDQIGHAVPFDLDLTLLPLCEVLQPVCDDRPLSFSLCLEESRPSDVSFLSIITSRGPPCTV